MLAPEGVAIVAGVAVVALVAENRMLSLCAAAALLAAAYVRRLVERARVGAGERMPPVTPAAALRHDIPRCIASVLARAAGMTVLGAVAGLPIAEAGMLGVAGAFAIGWVQLTRQVAIVRTFREEPDSAPLAHSS